MSKFDYYENVELIKSLSELDALFKLSKPSIFRIKGKDSSKAVLVSCLIHGSEPSGFRAFLKEINSNPDYSYDVYFFVGNAEAAKIKPYFTNRLVPGKQNFNRIWAENPTTDDELMAKEVFEFLETRPIIAHLDLHSFTAKDTKPHSFTISSDSKNLDVLKKIAEYIFIFDSEVGALIEKTSKFGPAFVIECGTNNSPEADEFSFSTLQRFLKEFSVKHSAVDSIKCNGIFTGMINIKLKPDISVSWDVVRQPDKNVTFIETANKLNITDVEPDTFFGWCKSLDVFDIKNAQGSVKPSEVFELKDNQLFIKQKVFPTLIAKNEKIAKESGFYFFTKKVMM